MALPSALSRSERPTRSSMSFPMVWRSLSADRSSCTNCQPVWCGYAIRTFMISFSKRGRMSMFCTRLMSWGRTVYHIQGSMFADCLSISASASALCRFNSQQSQANCSTRFRMKERRLFPRRKACRYPRSVKTMRFLRSKGQPEPFELSCIWRSVFAAAAAVGQFLFTSCSCFIHFSRSSLSFFSFCSLSSWASCSLSSWSR
mmetsp:Transcript_18246/g.54857  ORF Transcript_18246/g.54857 Transcript_18246/m.54857 type:complete len:202 (+) Transcript_18246:171-776(+)